MKIICRCEDITEDQILETIDKYECTTLSELKQILRLGMGHCQGRTCLLLTAKLLSKKTGKPLSDIIPSMRPLDIPVEIGMVGLKDE